MPFIGVMTYPDASYIVYNIHGKDNEMPTSILKEAGLLETSPPPTKENLFAETKVVSESSGAEAKQNNEKTAVESKENTAVVEPKENSEKSAVDATETKDNPIQ